MQSDLVKVNSSRFHAIVTVVFCWITLFVNISSAQASICGQFQHSKMNAENIVATYGQSLVRLEVGEEIGTGFVIDAIAGYVLTARHVILSNLETPSKEIRGVATAFSRDPISFHVVANDEKLDLAILKADPETALSNINSADIILTLPREGERVYALGFQLGDQHAIPIEGTIGRLMDGLLQMRENTFSGDSGCPLFDEQGRVFGVVTDKRYNGQLGTIIPLAAATEFVLKIPADAIVHRLIEQISQGMLGSEPLLRILQARRFRDSLNNLQAIMLGREVANLNPQINPIKALITCPMFDALTQRGLEDVAYLLASKYPSEISLADGSRVAMRIAENAEALGHEGRAAQLYEIAIAGLNKAALQHINRNRQGIALVACEAKKLEFVIPGPDKIPAAQDSFEANLAESLAAVDAEKGDACASGREDRILAALFRDSSVAAFRLSTLLSGEQRVIMQRKSIQTSALAVAVSEPGRATASSLALMGDGLLKGESYHLAAKAYAGAWQEGARVPWVKGNFEQAIAKREISQANDETQKLEIQNVTPLEPGIVYKFVFGENVEKGAGSF